jgi:hypothetical protein
MILSIPMFGFGRWGQHHALDLAAQDVTPERRLRKQQSIRRGGIAWQTVAVACLLTGLATLVTAH